MDWGRELLLRMFGRPKGFLGRLGGLIMARVNRDAAAQVIKLLGIRPDDKVLEVGFGPGVGIQLLLERITGGWVAGVDQSQEMIRQAAVIPARCASAGWTYATVQSRSCRLRMQRSTRLSPLIRCRYGRMPVQDYRRYGEFSNLVAPWRFASRSTPVNPRTELRSLSPLLNLQGRVSWTRQTCFARSPQSPESLLRL